MKFVPPDNRNAVSVGRLTLALAVAALVPLLLYGSAPSWWSQRDVLVEGQTADDYAPVNQGQLKNIAKAAVAEMDAKLSGGAGDELHSLIDSWSSSNPTTNDFASVNLGQLKNMARPFYDRLASAGIVDHYPWQSSLNTAEDFAVANIGQVKKLFSFDIPSANLIQDPLGDRIAAGQYSANLALEAHAVWIWGDHFAGGSEFERNYPRRVSELSSISSVSAGERHLVALRGDGTVWTWGESALGQLGDGTYSNRTAPALVPDLANIVSVKAGGLHTLALQQDGTIIAWGDNYYGQLGTGDTVGSAAPKPVTGLDGVRKIAAGFQRSVALKVDGTVWTWGYDHYSGQDIFNPFPDAVPELSDVIDIAAGYEHTIAVKADGTVWAWGSNYSNQIGNGIPLWKFQSVPAQVPNLSNIVKVASSYDHSLALAADGTVWAWGYNFFGQLGDGTNQARQAPVRVTGLTDVIAIATAYQYSLAMKADGTVWAWGDGAVGTLPGSDLHVPQLVGLGLLDTNHNGMDDRWEMQFLGNLDQSADTDFDGDGISNRQEYLRGTDPTDYFNGVTPVIEIASGNNQIGDPGTFLAKPFKVRVRTAAGQLLVNAPVTFTLVSGAGGLAPSPGGSQQQSLLLRTDTKGEAGAHHALPFAAGTSTRTTASAGKSAASALVVFRGIVRFSLPAPSPTPPPPGTSPTPTPTATPPAPYRYAVIDLGKQTYPIRINNRGQILVEGVDADDNWGAFRWKGGLLERLNYSGPHTEIVVTDMNDSAVVVGYFRNLGPWLRDKENEIEGGLLWPADNRNGAKVPAKAAFHHFEPQQPGSIRLASLNAVNNANDLFGEMCTGTVRGFLNHTIPVMNGQKWPAASASPTPLSNATAVNQTPDSDVSNWEGASDTVVRANSEGHYVGRKFTPFATCPGFLQGTQIGMIDGKPITFDPKDINEAGIVVGDSSPSGAIVIRTPKPSPSPSASPAPSAPEYTDKVIPEASALAINDHVLPLSSPSPQSSPMPSASPNSSPSPSPSPSPAPQILGWAGNAVVIWERQQDGETWHPFSLEEMIPSMEGWEYLEPYDMNDDGMIVGSGWFTDPSHPQTQGEQHGFLLMPVEIVELTPKLKDEAGDEIDDSDRSVSISGAIAMVEEPRQGQIPNVAYRVLKIRVPRIFIGKTIKWTMTPQFTPEDEGEPRFRGQWPQTHPDRFESDHPENDYVFERISQAEGRTTIDNNKETAIRINLPPIGFNKARVKIEFESYPGAFAEIDFEVPAIVVIDPGHGGIGRITDPDGGYSDGEHAIGPVSHIQEKTMALSYGRELRDSLKSVALDQQLNIKVFMTRETDDNFGPRARTNKARDNGADVLLSIHLNGSDGHNVRGTETWIRRPAENRNYDEDFPYAKSIQAAVFGAIHDFDSSTIDNRGIKDGGLVMTSDDQVHLGNTNEFHPIRAALVELEFLDNPVVDQLLNGSNSQAIQSSIVQRLSTAIIKDLQKQPAHE